MLKARVVHGRPLLETDTQGAPAVITVNQSFVKRFLPDTNPLGQRICISLQDANHWFTIIGVVADRRNLGQEESLGAGGYLSVRQFCPQWGSHPVFLVKTRPNPAVLGDAIREAVRSVDPNVPVYRPVTVPSAIEQAKRWNRGPTQALAAVGLFGLIMAMLGIYGVVAYSVTERTHEVGVRMALGEFLACWFLVRFRPVFSRFHRVQRLHRIA